MTGARIDVQWDDDKAVAALKRLIRLTADPSPILQNIANVILDATHRSFKYEESPDGLPWVESQRVRSEKAAGRSAKTLTDTQKLRNSMTTSVIPGEAAVGTNLVYAAIHQFGGRTGRGHSARMPARPFLGISDREERDIHGIISDALEDAVASHG